jgi:7-carboxy-7-deazaguanine synthase
VTYHVKEIFYTLQGEGANVGRPAVFCRFAGCNLWSGTEPDRDSAVCSFCDTDFVGTDGVNGGTFRDAAVLASVIADQWPDPRVLPRFVVLTGGEPLLQVDSRLVSALHKNDCLIAIETNGTIDPPEGIDWICVSPKAGSVLRARRGNELKVVVPQPALSLTELGSLPFDNFFVQPMDGPQLVENIKWATEWCLRHPAWRLSTQLHKRLGIP